VVVLAHLALACAGCDQRADASPAADAAAPPPAPAPTARAAPSASGSAAAEKGEFKVLKAVFTSEVKNKEPTDNLKSAKPGQRAWVHLTLRNRGDAARTITLVFKVNGKERSTVDLKVEPSWSFRTWAYNTLRAGDKGELGLEIRDDAGATMTTLSIPIKAADTPE
jgi:hypothetical protein